MDLALEARILASRWDRYIDPMVYHQPAPTSHLVAMVCHNCFNDHVPEDCIWDGYFSDCGLSVASLTSLPEMEDDEVSIISIMDTEEDEARIVHIPEDGVAANATQD